MSHAWWLLREKALAILGHFQALGSMNPNTNTSHIRMGVGANPVFGFI